MKRILSILLLLILFVYPLFSNTPLGYEEIYAETSGNTTPSDATAPISVNAPNAYLMEASTGTVLFEKNATESKPPASVTKVMTMLQIFRAIEQNKISLDDVVTVSEYAASMGGSQVYLEPGETQTVDTLLKCIAVSSANDACVAMAEHISGSEEAFVEAMNATAKELGMEHTHFSNTNGLTADNHVTSAKDIAIMSRELITKYPQVFDYCSIWMEDITHVTKKGSTTFGLANTNKFLKRYEYATGLKTGFTDVAKYCISATAKRNGIDLIAVVMGADTPEQRMQDAITMLNYGFGICNLYEDKNDETLEPIPISGGTSDSVTCHFEKSFSYLDTKGSDLSKMKKELVYNTTQTAPVKKGEVAGKAVYSIDGKEIGSINLLYDYDVEAAGFSHYLMQIWEYFTL